MADTLPPTPLKKLDKQISRLYEALWKVEQATLGDHGIPDDVLGTATAAVHAAARALEQCGTDLEHARRKRAP